MGETAWAKFEFQVRHFFTSGASTDPTHVHIHRYSSRIPIFGLDARVRLKIKPSDKFLYSIEYVDEEGDLEIKKAFLTDEEYRMLMSGIYKHGMDIRVHRLSPGPPPEPDGPISTVLSEDDRKLLGLPNSCDD